MNEFCGTVGFRAMFPWGHIKNNKVRDYGEVATYTSVRSSSPALSHRPLAWGGTRQADVIFVNQFWLVGKCHAIIG